MPKDVIVHLNGFDEDRTRIAHAAAIARIFDAHLTGFYAHELPALLSITDPAGSGFLQQLIEESINRALANTERLKGVMNGLGLRQELMRADLYPPEVGGVVAAAARTHDLYVDTRPYEQAEGSSQVGEAVLFGSGRACLFVPPSAPAPLSYDTVLVAWKNTREAAHAVSEAIPLLQRAKRVVVCVVGEGPDSANPARGDGADIARHLSRHGVSAEVLAVVSGAEPGDALLNEVKQHSADLLVLGAYGHSRFREWIAGGVTRQMLSECPVPVLVAH